MLFQIYLYALLNTQYTIKLKNRLLQYLVLGKSEGKCQGKKIKR